MFHKNFDTQLIPNLQPLVDESGADAIAGNRVWVPGGPVPRVATDPTRRGAREDAELETAFAEICARNATHKVLPFAPVMCDKRCNSPGLQLADLVARPIGRKLLDPAQPNRAYDILSTKFRRDRRGDERGWGLKVFP